VDGPPRTPAVVDAVPSPPVDFRASQRVGGNGWSKTLASSSKYLSPRRSHSKAPGVNSGPNRSFRPCDFGAKRFKTARNGPKRAETARIRTPSLPGVGDEFRPEPCDLRAIVRTVEARGQTGRRRVRAHRCGRARATSCGQSNQRPNKSLARRRGGGTLEVLISPPRDHRKGFSWVPSLCSASASVRLPAPPCPLAVEAATPCGLLETRRTDARRRHPVSEVSALPLAGARQGRASGRAVEVLTGAFRASSITTVVDPPAGPARTPRLAVFFSRFLRMRTSGHPVGERQSRYRTTRRSRGFGRHGAAVGTQGTFRRSRAATRAGAIGCWRLACPRPDAA
jgi:hypothetical protein